MFADKLSQTYSAPDLSVFKNSQFCHIKGSRVYLMQNGLRGEDHMGDVSDVA